MKKLILLAMCCLMPIHPPAYGADDFEDETFGIFQKDQKEAMKGLDVMSGLKKADAAANSNAFDRGLSICRELLKTSGLSLRDKKQIEEKMGSIESRRSSYQAREREAEEAKRQSDTAALIEKERIQSGQERERLLNATGDLTVYAEFEAWINMSATRVTFKIRRTKTIFGDHVLDIERTDSAGNRLFDSPAGQFYGVAYGLYEVTVNAYLESRKQYASFTADVVVNADSNTYRMVIGSKNVMINRQ